MKKLHLFCNAHIDVIWQWKSDEAIAATLSTFRVAAELCEKYDKFIFNHNEALLYQWVEEYDPALFLRIQKLVAEGKWHIVGGWMLQPDCLMPSGESFVRQMLYGRSYFKEKFGVEPETAVNFDSFGHARGLVQIMQQAGYKYYVFMRPDAGKLPELPQLFQWKGYDDSQIIGFRLNSTYSTPLGHAADMIEDYIKQNPDKKVAMRCWGIGNHGGGPSKKDVEDIDKLIEQYEGDVKILHSTPDEFFKECAADVESLPQFKEDLVSIFTGCYSTLLRIKQLHRRLENMLISAEKISVAAEKATGLSYPADELREAFCALAIMEFHDVLPGTCIKTAEEEALRLGNHGLYLAEQIHTKAMFSLTAGEKVAPNGGIPIFVWNPHPYEVEDVVECEYMLADQNWEDTLTMVHAFVNGEEVPCQNIKEGSNITLDWRKRVAVRAKFRPMAVTRIDLQTYTAPKPVWDLEDTDVYIFDNGEMQVEVNYHTGLIDRFCIDGWELVESNAFKLELFQDIPDPWRMDTDIIDVKKGEYSLLSETDVARVTGLTNGNFKPVRIIEDGEIFTRIEVLAGYNNSYAQIVYTLPKKGNSFCVDITSYFDEKDTLLRLTVPTVMENPVFIGQSVFGDKTLYNDGRESVAHKWIAAKGNGKCIVIANDGTYGSSNVGSVMRQTLLRSTAYCAHPIPNRPLIVNDRFLPRAEQGERHFHFRVTGGSEEKQIARAEHIAALENERLLAVNIFPKGEGKIFEPVVILSDSRIRLAACKKAEDGNGYVLRLFNPESETITTQVELPLLGIQATVELKHHQVQTYRTFSEGIRACHLLD